MSNIGPNNFRPPWQQSQAKQTAQTSASEAAGPAANSSGTNSGAALGNAVAQAGLSSLLSAGLNQELALGSTQLLQLLKNLLQMPKEMAQLLALLADADPASAQAMLQTLLASETPVPLEQLQQLLLSHADAAQDKLMKLLQTTAASPGGPSSQMGELLNTLNELAGKAKESPTQALQTTIGLYLPHFPLQPPQAFSLRYESPEQSDSEDSGEASAGEQLALFISTVSLGQFKINLAAQGQAPVQALVNHEPAAAPFEAEITAQVQQAIGGPGRIELVFIPNPSAGRAAQIWNAEAENDETDSSQTPKPERQQSVALHQSPGSGISFAALAVAYAIIRVILEIDDRNKLQQARAAMI